ncbi:MAG: ABC transporter permease, partial [Thermaceae bacterium]
VETFHLVLRNLLERPVRSLLTLLGVTVATSSMVLFLSFGEGMRRALSSELTRVGPLIQVLPEEVEGFVFGVSPEITPKMYRAIEETARELSLRLIPTLFLPRGGMDPASSFLIQGLPEGVGPDTLYPGTEAKEGSLSLEEGAVVGAKAAERGGLGLGSPLRLSQEVNLRVVGILKEQRGFADNFIYVPLPLLKKVLGTENYSAVFVQLPPGADAEKVARILEAKVPGIKAQTTGEVMRFAERALRITDLVRFGISLVALVVGGLLVANTVMMSVYERIREFGIMRALGARRGFIFQLVLLEALFLALLGGALGMGLGGLGSWAINLFTTKEVGLALSAITPRLLLFSLGVALALGLAAGLVPARTASRILVVEALGRV